MRNYQQETLKLFWRTEQFCAVSWTKSNLAASKSFERRWQYLWHQELHVWVLGNSFHAHGEYPGLSVCGQAVWSPRRGAVSDRGPFREKEHSPGCALSLLPRQADPASPRVRGAHDRTQDGGEEREELLPGANQTKQRCRHRTSGGDQYRGNSGWSLDKCNFLLLIAFTLLGWYGCYGE